MAQYGPNSGNVPFTGFSPTLGDADAINPVTSGNVNFNGMTQQDAALSRNLFHGWNRVARRLLHVLIGATTGSTATETRTQVHAAVAYSDPQMIGGLVTIDTNNLINRATASGDVTNLKAMLERTPAPTYVTDVAGIGGGGNLGF